MTEEIWKPLKGFENYYEISNYGEIKSFGRYIKSPIKYNPLVFKKEKTLRPSTNIYGYKVITLRDKKQHFIHLLVWDTFIGGEKRKAGYQIDHIDNNKENNFIDNLQLLTSKENTHKYHKTTDKMLPIGIHKLKNGFGYQVKVTIDGKRKYIGTYPELNIAIKQLNNYRWF